MEEVAQKVAPVVGYPCRGISSSRGGPTRSHCTYDKPGSTEWDAALSEGWVKSNVQQSGWTCGVVDWGPFDSGSGVG